MKFDLHMHTIFSDGRATPADVIDVAKAKNIGVSITDHNHIKGSILGYEIALKEQIPYICGIELGTNEGKEMLIYFDDPHMAERFYINEVEPFRTNRMTRIGRTMWDFVGIKGKRLKQEYRFYFSALPHPYGVLYKNINSNIELSKEIIKTVDAIEGINASMSPKANKLAQILALKYNKFVTASTDAHFKNLIGNLTTEVLFDKNKNIVLTDISHNSYSDNLFKKSITLLQITKCNIYHSILKTGKSRV